MVAAAAVVIALRGRIPDPASVVTVLAHADPRWLAAAVGAQLLSQAAFGLQQRTLLSALGTRLTLGDTLAVTFSRTAMGSVLPAGSAMSAAFALQQFRRRGASASAAATAVVLSGVASVAGLVLLYLGTTGVPALLSLAPAYTAELGGGLVALAAVVALVVRVRQPAASAQVIVAPGPGIRLRGVPATGALVIGEVGSRSPLAGSGVRSHRLSYLRRLGRNTIDTARRMLREARAVQARHWAAALGFAVLNWSLDLACLIAVAQACGFLLSALQLTAVYMAVQIVRQIPITPGGIGLIEASLLAGFLAAGAPEAAAAAVVLGYRIISFWLMLPIGLGAYLKISRRRPAAPLRSPISLPAAS
ncbi:lysylphosphatidylglycerol synthase transmembrane domain-containing protein [Actinoplanes sp. NPDC049596]|uniref:lysylphosphatidylglycerol synthase transmembrane domain-containing protein n=1 Tax=unclassified Actinoplanes TaxID=2626549 RepID=UPI0034234A97